MNKPAGTQKAKLAMVADECDALVVEAISKLGNFVSYCEDVWRTRPSFLRDWDELQERMRRDIKTCEGIEQDPALACLKQEAQVMKARIECVLSTFSVRDVKSPSAALIGNYEIGNFLGPKMGSIDLTFTVSMPARALLCGFGYEVSAYDANATPAYDSFILNDVGVTRVSSLREKTEPRWSLSGGLEENQQRLDLEQLQIKFGLLAIPFDAGPLKVISRLKETKDLLAAQNSQEYDALGIITRNETLANLVRSQGFAAFLLSDSA